jgi:hypothetical protein
VRHQGAQTMGKAQRPYDLLGRFFFPCFRQQVSSCFGSPFESSAVEGYLGAGNLPTVLHSIHSNPLQPPYILRENHPLQPQCSSSVSLPPSWLSVSSIVTTRSDRWSLSSRVVLAVASTLAGREAPDAREFETRDD